LGWFGYWVRRGFGRGRGCPPIDQFKKAAMGTKKLAVITGFVAADEIERAGVVTESAEGEGGAGGVVLVLGDGFGLAADLAIESGLFEAHYSRLTPAGEGHGLNERCFDSSLRLQFIEKRGQEFCEAIPRFAFQNDGAAEHAMFHGIAGGGEFALGGFGAAGFGSVGARGFLLA
jgi:hypothetical protein